MGPDFPCLYRYSLEEARRCGETRLHEESFRQNVSCALAEELRRQEQRQINGPAMGGIE